METNNFKKIWVTLSNNNVLIEQLLQNFIQKSYMRKLLVLIPLLLALSCINNKGDKRIMNPQNLRSQYFKINPDIDTTLVGLRGGIFKIEKGSFDGKGILDIEIKEVYSPIEIAYAGLITESDGRLLESGGMIYFNAKRNGKQAKLLKSIDISIPTNYINKEMQLFKGKENADGNINWVEPKPLDFKSTPPAIDTGEVLFNTMCASCHQLFRDATGPALAGVEQRGNDRKVLKAFIRNPAAIISENNYFNCQKNKFGSMHPAFSNLS